MPFYFLIIKIPKFLKFKFIELQKLIGSIKYIGLFSPLTRFWALNLFVYSLFYPILRLALEKEKTIKICEYFIKTPFSSGTFSFPNLMKSKIIIREDNQDWNVFIEIHLRDTYHKNTIKEGMNIVDAGAHIGAYSILSAEKVGNSGKIIAVEPEAENYKLLMENINLNNFKNVIPINIALSDHNGSEKLYFSQRSTSHSLLVKDNETSSFSQVQVKTLDRLLEELNLKKIDIIKIDTEGAEMPILRGAEKTLKNNPNAKIIVASYHYPGETEEVQNFLQERGFKTKILYSDIITTI